MIKTQYLWYCVKHFLYAMSCGQRTPLWVESSFCWCQAGSRGGCECQENMSFPNLYWIYMNNVSVGIDGRFLYKIRILILKIMHCNLQEFYIHTWMSKLWKEFLHKLKAFVFIVMTIGESSINRSFWPRLAKAELVGARLISK